MSPGSVTERLYFFVGEYFDGDKVSDGGGVGEDGEEIEVLELPLDTALAMIGSGDIADAKTIMLLQYAKLHGVLGWISTLRYGGSGSESDAKDLGCLQLNARA
ncbi:hypothetical protein NCPPB940_15990 [Xanthomonas hortorum pv. taraxaci]|nr:hypothetical protein NCPPB940_15990 [Xanthomonas hortorum pv. taraxaci]CAD0320657.1 hypothetical protein NCPPB940_15990 [Xanthomonas hortorum pv. taraxaci]